MKTSAIPTYDAIIKPPSFGIRFHQVNSPEHEPMYDENPIVSNVFVHI
jgi:hypothetical protein